MSYREILNSIESVLAHADEQNVHRLVSTVDSAPRLFIGGAGRSALAARFFAMRLMHCGYTVYLVGDVVTPALAADDVLIVLSGSGATESLLTIARKARAAGAGVVLITSQIESPLAGIASDLMLLGADGSASSRPGMPMGTVFELSALIFLEAAIFQIINTKALTEDMLRARHANLE